MRIAVRRVLKIALMGLAGLLLAVQVIRPSRTNPPVDPARTLRAQTHLSSEVGAILDRACIDCHSHETRWPWYSQVAPFSWFVINHVNDGRRHLNFSRWPDKIKVQDHKLAEMCEMVEKGFMPLSSYTWIHRGSVLAPGEAQTICAWTKTEQERLSAQSPDSVPSSQPPPNAGPAGTESPHTEEKDSGHAPTGS